MSNEAEKPIEQALHAYAKQRRDGAGALLELHPATRQMLQDEVARTLVLPGPNPTSRLQFLLAAWPRLAFGGAIFATLVFVLVLLQTGNRVGPDGSRMELAQHEAESPAEKELLKSLDSSARGEPEAKDRDEVASKPMPTDPSESLNEAKRDSYARPTPPPAAAVPMPRPSKLAAPAAGSREELTRPDLPFTAKSETAETKAKGTPAASELAGGVGATRGLTRESRVSRQSGDKSTAEAQQQLRIVMEPSAQPAIPAQAPLRSLARPQGTETTLTAAADNRPVKIPSPANTAPPRAGDESGKTMKRMVRGAHPAAEESPNPLPALPNATNLFSYQSVQNLHAAFEQEDSRARYRRNLNSPPVPNVLTSFRIERAGNEVRLIDADGSTYIGKIINGTAGLNSSPRAAQNATIPSEAREKAPGQTITQRGLQAFAERVGNPSATGFAFQASGTNQTLNQSVEFTGILEFDPAETKLDEGSAPARAKARIEGPAPASDALAKARAKPLELLRGRIHGQALVGGKNQFEIIAVPATK